MVYIEISIYTMDNHAMYIEISEHIMDIHGIYVQEAEKTAKQGNINRRMFVSCWAGKNNIIKSTLVHPFGILMG